MVKRTPYQVGKAIRFKKGIKKPDAYFSGLKENKAYTIEEIIPCDYCNDEDCTKNRCPGAIVLKGWSSDGEKFHSTVDGKGSCFQFGGDFLIEPCDPVDMELDDILGL